MSTDLLSVEHIDCLVTALLPSIATEFFKYTDIVYRGCCYKVVYDKEKPGRKLQNEVISLSQIGKILLLKNYQAFNKRYDMAAPIPNYKFKKRTIILQSKHMVNLLSACNCYDSQVISYSYKYDQSFACAIMKRIQADLIEMLPGYAEAPSFITKQFLTDIKKEDN